MSRMVDVPEQYNLEGIRLPVQDRIFFALFPEPGIAQQAVVEGEKVRRQAGLRAAPFRPRKLHVSLHWLGDYAGMRQDVVTRACEAASRLRLASFEIIFDRLGSFKGTPDHHPLVFTASQMSAELTELYVSLGMSLARHGVDSLSGGFNPHMTLLYGERQLKTNRVPPLRWSVREFWLVHSALGEGRYTPLGRFPLAG